MGFELQSSVVVLCCFEGPYLIHEESETQRLNDLPKREEKVNDPSGVSLRDTLAPDVPGLQCCLLY